MIKSMITRAAMMLCMAVALVACGESDNYPYKTDYLPVQLPGSARWSILDVNTGALVVKDAFDEAPSPVIGGMFYVMNGEGTFDYYNIENPTKAVNGEHYGSVTVFSEDGLAVASKRGGALCVIDRQCNVVRELPKEVSQCSMFSRGMAAYQNDLGLWGYINTKGDTVVPAKYQQANLFVNDDVALVVDPSEINDSTANFQVIDKKGTVLYTASATEYGIVQPYYISGVLPVVKRVENRDTVVCLNTKGEEVPNPNKDHDAVDKGGYQDYSRTPGGLYIVVGKEGKMGVVDRNNKTLVEAKHERITDLRNDRFIVGKDSLYSLIDDKGAPVGKVKFVHAHGGSEHNYATRGFIDTNLAVASMMAMLGGGRCAGATRGTTLMDMNGMLGDNPEQSVGQNGIAIPQGPFLIRYIFDAPIASRESQGAPASYNLDARVSCVDISLNVTHCGLDTEAAIVGPIQAAMGTKGFVLDKDGMFVDEQGQVITVGYSDGVVSLAFFTDPSMAKPLPRNPRK